MLQNNLDKVDILSVRKALKPFIPEELSPYFISETPITEINFPVLSYPKKIKSFTFKKNLEYQGVLKGIKGQYLIFEDGTVLNVRSNSGYIVDLDIH